MSLVRTGCVVGAIVAMGGVGWWSLDRGVLADMDELRTKIAQAEDRIEFREKQAATLKRDRRVIEDIASRTIAGDAEQGVHTLRLALTGIAEAAGLRDVSVTSRHAGVAVNPGSRELTVLKVMKDTRDFDVVAGSLTGRGDVAQVVRAMALLDAQPWPRRVPRVTLAPEDGGQVIKLTIDVQTMAVPDHPPEVFTSELVALDAAGEALVARLTARNVFAPPPPPPKPRPEPKPQKDPPKPGPPKPAPPPPYGDWRVSGVIEAGPEAELWLSHANSGQTLRLTEGQSHLDAVFAGVIDGMAIISIGGDRYALGVGKTLADRDHPLPGQ